MGCSIIKINKNAKYNTIPGFSKYIIFKDGRVQINCEFKNYKKGDYICTIDNNFNIELFSDKLNKFINVNLLNIMANLFIGLINLPIIYTSKLSLVTSLKYDMTNATINKLHDNVIIICNKRFIEISSYPNYYISNDGMVYDYNRNEFLQKHFSKGYLKVSIKKNSKFYEVFVHRLVFETFNDKIIDGYTINHKDGCKQNNLYTNLEQITNLENFRHAHITGLRPNARWMPEDIHKICKKMEDNICSVNIGKELGLTTKEELRVFATLCSDIRNKKIWKDISNNYDFSKYDTKKYLTNSKLNENDVLIICKLLQNGVKTSEISNKYNITQSLVNAIRSGKRWKHITDKFKKENNLAKI